MSNTRKRPSTRSFHRDDIDSVADENVGNHSRQHTRARDERDLNAAHREKLAIEMRMQGHDFDAIAEACGYGSRASAFKAWRRAIQRIPQTSADEARRNMQESYNLMRRALYENVASGKTWAIEAWLKVDERESKLLGLDATKDSAQMGAGQILIRRYDADTDAV